MTRPVLETTASKTHAADPMEDAMREVDAVIRARLSSRVALIDQISHYIIGAGGKRIGVRDERRDHVYDNASLAAHAEQLRALHHAERPLVLPNAWDAASATTVQAEGFPVETIN